MMSKNAQNRSKLLEIARILSLASARTQLCVLTVCQQQRWQVLEHCANSRISAGVGTFKCSNSSLGVLTLAQRPCRVELEGAHRASMHSFALWPALACRAAVGRALPCLCRARRWRRRQPWLPLARSELMVCYYIAPVSDQPSADKRTSVLREVHVRWMSPPRWAVGAQSQKRLIQMA